MKLPKGVSLKTTSADGALVVIGYDEGFATLDYKKRGFGLGQCGYVRAMTGYTGCKWRERLLADAVTELKTIYDTPTKVAK